jgi:transposase InsO family protein
MDTMKIALGVYQYTAVDDCSRFRVLGVHPFRKPRNTFAFLGSCHQHEIPFPIQRIQTNRGTEFFAESVQRRLMAAFIKFRPIPPRSPHLNGKIERSQDRFGRILVAIFFRKRKQFNSASKVAIHLQLPTFAPELVVAAYGESKERIGYSDWKKDTHGSATQIALAYVRCCFTRRHVAPAVSEKLSLNPTPEGSWFSRRAADHVGRLPAQ